MTARPDRERSTRTSSTRPQTTPAALVRLSDAQPHRTTPRKRHRALTGGAPVVSISDAPSIRDQLTVPTANRRTARVVLGGFAPACRVARIEPASLLAFERGRHLSVDEFARLDQLVRSALALRKFGR